jgi:CheY-like chemotaxis protein
MLNWFKSATKTKGERPIPGTPAPSVPQPFADNSTTALQDGPQLAAPGKSRRVLVVDDNLTVLKAIEMKLQAGGFTVFTATDAATVAGTAQKVKPELILLDLNFPSTGSTMEWSGLTAIQWLRRFPELSGIPVIVISGTDCAAKDKALAAGAKAFFHKPVIYKELESAMLSALGMQPA